MYVQVNGVDVAGLSRPDVVQLLRDSQDTATLIISRQEMEDEEHTEHEVSKVCVCACRCACM